MTVTLGNVAGMKLHFTSVFLPTTADPRRAIEQQYVRATTLE